MESGNPEMVSIRKNLEFLKCLVEERVDFMIVGMSAAVLHGAPTITKDIDLWFKDFKDPGIRRAVERMGGSILDLSQFMRPTVFAGDNLEYFDVVTHMHGLNGYEEEEKLATRMLIGETMVKVLGLERIIQSKKAANRLKDKAVLPLLLSLQKAVEKQK